MDPTKYFEVSKLSQMVATFAKENLINFIKKFFFSGNFYTVTVLLNVTIIPVFTLFTIGDVVVKI